MGAVDLPLQITRHRLNVAEFHRMAEAGIFSPDERVELIDLPHFSSSVLAIKQTPQTQDEFDPSAYLAARLHDRRKRCVLQ